MPGRTVQYLLDQLCFPGRDSIPVCLLLQGIVIHKGLPQHCSEKAVRLQQLVYFLRQLFLQPASLDRIVVVDTDQDRICQFIQITVPQHGADQGVDRHIDIAPRKIHVPHHDRSVFIQRFDLQHSLLFIHHDLNARIHLQRYGGCHLIIDLITVEQQSPRPQHDQHTCGRHHIFHNTLLFLCFRHHDHRSFPFFTVREDHIADIRNSVRIGLFYLRIFTRLLIPHCSPP